MYFLAILYIFLKTYKTLQSQYISGVLRNGGNCTDFLGDLIIIITLRESGNRFSSFSGEGIYEIR